MSIAMLKQIGDLQKEQKTIGEQFSKLYTARKQKTIKQAVSDFEDFFGDQGFAVSKAGYPNRVTATHGQLSVALGVPDEKDGFFGAVTVFPLETNLLEKHNYTVAVREKGSHFSVSVRTVSSNGAEEEKERQEIEKLTESIESLKARVQSIDSEEWQFEVYEGGYNPNAVQKFASMRDLLNALIQ